MIRFFSLLTLLDLLTASSCSQGNLKIKTPEIQVDQKAGGGCDGCDAIFVQSPLFEKLDWIDTLPDFNEMGPKLEISGIINENDGVTPAADIILYVYHTDQSGHYAAGKNQTGSARRHGYIRGWMKTNEKGEYKFYTLKPVAYPSRNIPAHIHPIIKAPGFSEYYIDEYLFDNDPLLTTEERKKQEGRGGNGILVLEEKDGMFKATRNIILGLNIPGYPAK